MLVATSSHSDDKELIAGDSLNMEGRLTIFGNANNDDYIDSRDVEEIKNIIAGKSEAKYFICYKEYKGKELKRSLADANADGKIDEADVQWVQDMVSRKNNMALYYYDVDKVISSCTYPINKVVIGFKSNYEATLICGAADRCVGACNQVSENGPYSQWYKAFSSASGVGSRFTFDYERFPKMNADAVITGTRVYYDVNMEEICAPLKLDIIRMPFWEDLSPSGVLTYGYLMGCEKASQKYVEKVDSVIEVIKDKLKSKPYDSRPVVYPCYDGTKIHAMRNGIMEMVIAAGGRTVLDAGYKAGIIDGEGILKMNPDFIVFDLLQGFLETFNQTNPSETKNNMVNLVKNTDAKYFKLVSKTDAYKKGNVCVIGQGTFIGPASYIGVAYLANMFYPDLFNFDTSALLADYVNAYHPDFDASKIYELQFFKVGEV